ncbi:MAG TPA: hypothetical protein VGG98_04155 [Solirubrobacteraceae bacterium]
MSTIAPASSNQPLPAAVADLLQLNEGLVGASTGYMKEHRGDWSALVEGALELSTGAVELSALSIEELPTLLDYLSDGPALPFDYVAVHAPAKGGRGQLHRAASLLGRLPQQVVSVVTHPEAINEHASSMRALGSRLVLENMNLQKRSGRTAAHLAPYFTALPRARFCLDIAHAYQCDSTLALADVLLDAHAHRLAQVHLSSIRPDGIHVPLTEPDAATFRPILERCVGVPWILEAPLR